METRNLQFCFYYKGEMECPYKPNSPSYDNDAGFAWMSEAICSKIYDMDVNRFLDFICAHMGKWDPYSYVDRFSRYLLANTRIPLEQRIAYAEKNFVRNHPIHKMLEDLKKQDENLVKERPEGYTVFEYYGVGTFPYGKYGYLLYSDGRVYTVCRDKSHDYAERYRLIATSKPLADEVKKFIEENQDRVDALPEEIPVDNMMCDGARSYYKFLNKTTEGYMVSHQEVGKDLCTLHDEIIAIIRKNGVELGEE